MLTWYWFNNMSRNRALTKSLWEEKFGVIKFLGKFFSISITYLKCDREILLVILDGLRCLQNFTKPNLEIPSLYCALL